MFPSKLSKFSMSSILPIKYPIPNSAKKPIKNEIQLSKIEQIKPVKNLHFKSFRFTKQNAIPKINGFKLFLITSIGETIDKSNMRNVVRIMFFIGHFDF